MIDMEEPEFSIDWLALLSTLWSSRKLIAAVVGGTTVFAVVVSLLLPKYYKSTATLLPETDKSKLAGLAGLAGIASLAGVGVGEVPLEKLYPTIIESEAVLKEVIYATYKTERFSNPVNLIQYWEIEEETPLRDYEIALKLLQEELDVSIERQTNVVTLSLLTREPQLSADILNNIVAELDKFLRTKKTTNATEQRKWIEARLEEVKKDLERSENVLKEFREKNRRVIDSPQLLLEQERLIREVQINTTLYTELKKQYELIKIEEIKNIPLINVMDPARPAAKKDKPKRAFIVLVSFFLSALGSFAYVVTMNHYAGRVRQLLSVFRSTRGSAPS